MTLLSRPARSLVAALALLVCARFAPALAQNGNTANPNTAANANSGANTSNGKPDNKNDNKTTNSGTTTGPAGNDTKPKATPEPSPTPCPAGPDYDPQVVSVRPDKGNTVQLGDVIDVEVLNYQCLQAQAVASKPQRNIVLFLDGMPVLRGTAYPPTDPSPSGDPKTTKLKFTLTPTYKPDEGARDVWTAVLGSPSLTKNRDVLVSVGIEDQFAIPPVKDGANKISLDVVPAGWFWFWLFIFVILAVGFVVMARRTDVLRDSVPAPGGGDRRPYSLARTQAAWWFFLILAAYLFIGIITGDFLTSITSTALVLLGISAGTTLTSAFVDVGRAQSPVEQAKQIAAVSTLESEIDGLKKDIKSLEGEVKAQPQPANFADLETQLAQKRAELETRESQSRKMNNVSEYFWRDILSDANGVSFHRFQMLGWSLVLGLVFVAQVYKFLAMPKFDSTLLTLLGISAGTFVGMKTTESTDPTAKK